MPKSKKPPTYRRHKASGQALVTVNRQDIYLGPYGSAESRELYAKLLSGAVRPESLVKRPPSVKVVPAVTASITVVELLAKFLEFAQLKFWGPDGKPTSDLSNWKILLRRLRTFAGRLTVTEFGPLRLREFRETLIAEGLARTMINNRINMVRRIFSWGVGRELVPPSVLEALRAVEALLYGKTTAKESAPVKSVPEAWVRAVLPFCAPQIAAMIELQLLTGMRSGELVIMRTRDLNTTGRVWQYRPIAHKTAYRGHERIIYIGPQAQEVLRPWLRTNLEEYLFQPAEVEVWRRAQLTAQR